MGYINTGDSLRRRLWEYSNAHQHHVLTNVGLLPAVDKLKNQENEEMRNEYLAGGLLDLSTLGYV